MRPRWYADHPLLAAVAAHLHRQRIDGYPALIAAGTLSTEVAAAELRISAAIAADWQAIAACAPEPAGIHDGDAAGAWAFERRATLERMVRATRAAAEATAWDDQLAGIADATATLLWWETAEPRARFYADFNAQARAHAAAIRAEQALEAIPPAGPPRSQPRWRPATAPARPVSSDLFGAAAA